MSYEILYFRFVFLMLHPQVALLYGESRPSDVRAKTYCEIIVFTKKDLDGVLKDFPVVAK